MKKLILTLLILFSISASYAQKVEVKANVLAGAIAIFNPSIEIGIAGHSAISMDYMGAYAKDNWLGTDRPFLMSMGLFGYRYYLKRDTFKGWFLGGDFGLDTFKMNRNIVTIGSYEKKSIYDVGYGYVIGATLGYKHHFKNRFGIEISGSFGFHHCQHESYYESGIKGEMSASAEWIPYKAGVYLSYRIGANK